MDNGQDINQHDNIDIYTNRVRKNKSSVTNAQFNVLFFSDYYNVQQ